MKLPLKPVIQLAVLFLLCLVLPGCGGRDSESIDDALWANGRLRFIVSVQHYVARSGNAWGYRENSDYLAGADWSLSDFPVPGNSSRPTTKDKFAVERVADDMLLDGFLLIAGSDLMIHEHHLVGMAGTERQFVLYDPNTGMDISKPLFRSPSPICVLNRSRTACLTLDDGQAVVYDILSARYGDPKISPRPTWTAPLLQPYKHAFNGALVFRTGLKERIILTDDTQHLVLSPDDGMDASFRGFQDWERRTNFDVEVFSINGGKEWWTIPPERRGHPFGGEQFVDAELIDGRIELLSVQDLGGLLHVRVVNMQGATLHYRKLDEFEPRIQWDPHSQTVLSRPREYSPTHPDSAILLWNYDSDNAQEIRLHR